MRSTSLDGSHALLTSPTYRKYRNQSWFSYFNVFLGHQSSMGSQGFLRHPKPQRTMGVMPHKPPRPSPRFLRNKIIVGTDGAYLIRQRCAIWFERFFFDGMFFLVLQDCLIFDCLVCNCSSMTRASSAACSILPNCPGHPQWFKRPN